jgi:hypothetical protein
MEIGTKIARRQNHHKGDTPRMTDLRDSNGFLIVPKNMTYWGYNIRSVTFDDKTVYDVYLGHVYRETFNSVADAKRYIEQPKF